MHKTILQAFIAVLAVASLAGCSGDPGESIQAPKNEGSASLKGEAFYLNKIALADDAVLSVQLQEVTHSDAPTIAIAGQRIELGGRQQPFGFELRYEPAELRPNRVYTVNGRIEDSSGLRFISAEQPQLLLTGAAQTVRLKLDQVLPGSDLAGLAANPGFSCRGNEPFWNLEIQDRKLQLSRLIAEVEEKTYHGGFARYAAADGAVGYQWQGESKAGRNSQLLADIRLEYCADSMAGPEEGGEFDYSIQLLVDDETLRGCCNLLEPSVNGADEG